MWWSSQIYFSSNNRRGTCEYVRVKLMFKPMYHDILDVSLRSVVWINLPISQICWYLDNYGEDEIDSDDPKMVSLASRQSHALANDLVWELDEYENE